MVVLREIHILGQVFYSTGIMSTLTKLSSCPILALLIAVGGASAAGQAVTANSGEPITLDEAIHRAQAVDAAYGLAVADAAIAHSQKGIARSALLAGVVYHNQYLFTQGQRTSSTSTPTGQSVSPVRFIANNAVHEYMSQGVVTETIGGASVADYRRADADAAGAKARLEVARRDLVSRVVATYYAVLAADTKRVVAERAVDEAARFLKITQQREAAGEVAHADTVKADLQMEQRQRDLSDATLAADKSRQDLGVLLYPDPATAYVLAATLDQATPLPSRETVDSAAQLNNPDIKAAFESLRAANLEVASARFGYLPDLSLNYTYGIDAPQFAVNGPDGARNLGYSASATLDIPVWDWLATHERVHQSAVRKAQAQVELTFAQRRLLADLNQFYQEASASEMQLALLDKSVQTATESLRLTNLRYAAGEGTVLEVVDAQSSLVSAQLGRADGAVRYHIALASLQTLTGSMP